MLAREQCRLAVVVQSLRLKGGCVCVRIYNIMVGTDDGRRDIYLFFWGGSHGASTPLLLAAVASLSL